MGTQVTKANFCYSLEDPTPCPKENIMKNGIGAQERRVLALLIRVCAIPAPFRVLSSKNMVTKRIHTPIGKSTTTISELVLTWVVTYQKMLTVTTSINMAGFWEKNRKSTMT